MSEFASVEQIYRERHRALVRLANRWGLGQDAEDHVQDSYVRFLRYDLPREGRTVNDSYVFSTVKMTCLMARQKQLALKRSGDLVGLDTPGLSEGSHEGICNLRVALEQVRLTPQERRTLGDVDGAAKQPRLRLRRKLRGLGF